jgi:hypothetical protein
VSQIGMLPSFTEGSWKVQGGWALLPQEPAVALWASGAAARYGSRRSARLGSWPRPFSLTLDDDDQLEVARVCDRATATPS